MASYNIINAPENDYLDMTTARAVMDAYGGLAKSCRFYVRIVPAGGLLARYSNNIQDFSYLCESAEFPGRGFMSTDIRYYGTNNKMPYQTTYEDLNLTFICRNDFTERNFFDNWMQIINPLATYDFAYRDDYISSIEIFQLSDLDEGISSAVYSFCFENAYPVLVNPQPVTWADDNFHRLTVSFTYNRWYRPGIDPVSAQASNLVTGAQNSFSDKAGTPLLDPNNYVPNSSVRGPR